MIKTIYSWLCGRYIGELRYEKDCPFMIGNMRHFLPVDLWTEEMKNQVRFRYEKYIWTGFKWHFVSKIETYKSGLEMVEIKD